METIEPVRICHVIYGYPIRRASAVSAITCLPVLGPRNDEPNAGYVTLLPEQSEEPEMGECCAQRCQALAKCLASCLLHVMPTRMGIGCAVTASFPQEGEQRVSVWPDAGPVAGLHHVAGAGHVAGGRLPDGAHENE